MDNKISLPSGRKESLIVSLQKQTLWQQIKIGSDHKYRYIITEGFRGNGLEIREHTDIFCWKPLEMSKERFRCPKLSCFM